jgi:hypothetical protein
MHSHVIASILPERMRELHVEDPVAEFGNCWGHVALWSFSFFLIPVARYSPLVHKVLGWDVAATLHRFHVWPGRLIVVASVIHGAVHMYRWKFLVGESVAAMIFPSMECWRGATYNQQRQEECLDEITGCSCYDSFRNLVGFFATAGMVIIGVTSLYSVRRQF